MPRDPNAEEVIDAFVQNIVCRHGVPRALVCDRGSNLIAELARSVYELLGVDLRPSTAYHHMTAGVVERFNRTLNGLLRATGKEGKDWPLHVPWLCFYFRATPHTVTKESPAFLNLGRELRYPHDRVMFEGTEVPALDPDHHQATHSAAQLSLRLKLAWEEAGRVSLRAQLNGKERRDLSFREPQYEVDQWVLLRRPTNDQTGVPKGGKLAPIYEGPYRIEAILDRGNVRLRDLPRKIHNEFHVTRLRPYVPHDEIPVAEDEYKVRAILNRRRSAAQRQYLVWWLGYPKSAATWEPQANLLTRCFDMVASFDAARDKVDLSTNTTKEKPPSPSEGAQVSLEETNRLHQDQDDKESAISPDCEVRDDTAELLHLAAQQSPAVRAKRIKGVWHYERTETLRGGRRVARMVDHRYYTPEELESFAPLRDKAVELETNEKTPPQTQPPDNRPPKKPGQLQCLPREHRSITQPSAPPCGPRRSPRIIEGRTLVAATRPEKWDPFEMRHYPDAKLMSMALRDGFIGERSSQALIHTLLRTTRDVLEGKSEKLKQKLFEPDASRSDHNEWVLALEEQFENRPQPNPERRMIVPYDRPVNVTIPPPTRPLSPSHKYKEAMVALVIRSLEQRAKDHRLR